MEMTLLNHTKRDGISAKNGKPYKMILCQVVLKGHDGALVAGRLALFGDQYGELVNGAKYEMDVQPRVDRAGDLSFGIHALTLKK